MPVAEWNIWFFYKPLNFVLQKWIYLIGLLHDWENLNLKLVILLLVDLRANKAVKLDFSSVQQEFYSGNNQSIKILINKSFNQLN